MGHLVVGRDSAIAVLYRRYAARLADMAEPIVGRSPAEDIARQRTRSLASHTARRIAKS